MTDEEVKPTGFYVAEAPTGFQNVVVKDGKVIDLLDLIADIANKVERAGLK